MVVLLALIWGIQLLAAGRYVDTLGIMALGSWFFLAFPNAFAFHLTLGGGVLGGLLAFTSLPAFLGLQAIQAGVAAGLGYLLFKGLNSRIRLLQSLTLYGLCLAGVSFFLRWGLGIALSPREGGLYLLLCALWSSLVLALLPLWETLFEVVSPLRLMELSHPSSPLLKRLQVEAPGTYYHVLMVGTLAEAAAERLGLDGLLVRAGAYYHDVGKLRRPKFFVENQQNGENAHDQLTPSLSALVILSHVRDGLEIAQEYGLPVALRAFIPEHHGTTCLAYFYRKSKNLGESLPVEQFCYPGPRPRSRETALVMLADSVEAAVKASGPRTEDPEDLRELVDEVIQSKLASHQLDYVDFSLRDLSTIRETFLELLRSMRHSRRVRPLASREGVPGDPTIREGETNRLNVDLILPEGVLPPPFAAPGGADLRKRILRTWERFLKVPELGDPQGAFPEGLRRLEVSLSFRDRVSMEELNRDYRGVEGPTDVLSFPLWGGGGPFPASSLGGPSPGGPGGLSRGGGAPGGLPGSGDAPGGPPRVPAPPGLGPRHPGEGGRMWALQDRLLRETLEEGPPAGDR